MISGMLGSCEVLGAWGVGVIDAVGPWVFLVAFVALLIGVGVGSDMAALRMRLQQAGVQ